MQHERELGKTMIGRCAHQIHYWCRGCGKEEIRMMEGPMFTPAGLMAIDAIALSGEHFLEPRHLLAGIPRAS
jgi:hypothetical protein